jgi:cytochrome c oxidase subunit 2
VPEWRLKQDVVPGIVTKLLITPDRIGSYDVVCTELCGLGHAVMRARARVLSQADFDAWVKGRTQAASTGGADQGKELFASQGCSSCHTLADAGATGQIGPDLDKVLVGKDAAFVRQSIVDPNAEIAAGYKPDVMPQNFGKLLSTPQLDGLVDYLVSATSKGG